MTTPLERQKKAEASILPPEFLDIVLEATRSFYREGTTIKPALLPIAHRFQFCHYASDAIVGALRQSGIETRREMRYHDDVKPSGTIGSAHSYVVYETGDGEVIIDPTWQQFLSYPSEDQFADLSYPEPNLPEVFIGSRDGIVTLLERLGVTNEGVLGFWRKTLGPDFHTVKFPENYH